jgi:hypothetical protein
MAHQELQGLHQIAPGFFYGLALAGTMRTRLNLIKICLRKQVNLSTPITGS